MIRGLAQLALFASLMAFFSMSTRSYAAACTHKIEPVEGAQTFTVTIPAITDARNFSFELAKQIGSVAPGFSFQRADEFSDYVFVGTSSKDTEKQVLVYLVKTRFLFGSGVKQDEPFYQSTAALLEELKKSGQIIAYAANSQVDPSEMPIRRVIDICVPM